eukprot:TRINITY_DN95894_c0_g1_i1.p1 TRINITY_DN95894_c0_g1~~TRINITY_DN95894_c0_g1_i1.p1  ORF type:complete len:231 (+),score=36.15 TRINITY_DN95894_c0_g1_i1:71-763(+)
MSSAAPNHAASLGTPLANGVAQVANLHQGEVQQRAENAVAAASNAARETFKKITHYIEDHPNWVARLSVIGGMVLAVVSVLHVIVVPSFLLGPITYCLHVFQLFFACLICIIDGPADKTPCGLHDKVLRHASFLHTSSGRVVFYMFIACFVWNQDEWITSCVSMYFAFIALVHLYFAIKNRNQSRGPEASIGQHEPDAEMIPDSGSWPAAAFASVGEAAASSLRQSGSAM